jgi:hypothetical protein
MDSALHDVPGKILDDSGAAPSPAAQSGLRRVPDKFPPVALLILIVEVSYPRGPTILEYRVPNTGSLTLTVGGAIHLLWAEWAYSKLYQVCVLQFVYSPNANEHLR